MQIYAEDNLEFANKNNETTESFLELLENSKTKVKESGESKNKYDLEQIEAFKYYQESLLNVQKLEKSNKKTILKSKPYYELKASINKELKFQLSKVEGLKSCLKEAKLFYHQSMKNLETISNEEHSKRQQRKQEQQQQQQQQQQQSACSSAANTQLITSSSMSSTTSYNRNNTASTNDDDIYCNNIKKSIKRSTSSSNNSVTDISIDSNNTNKCISDEQIINLSLDNKLYKYKQQIKLRPQFRASFVMKTNI
jgi:hypothetical protein